MPTSAAHVLLAAGAAAFALAAAGILAASAGWL